jgi:dethiobiotin synthetase
MAAATLSPKSRRTSAVARRIHCPGLFVVGTDTGVGKTYVASRIAATMFRAGVKVGVYKPAASGCRKIGRSIVSDDAVVLWEAAGRPGTLKAVCPQRFAAALAPPLAAREERKQIDSKLLRRGIDLWRRNSDFIVVEGAGGLMSPIGDQDYVADLAAEFGYPLIVVVPNRIGAINSTLLTLIAAASRDRPLPVAGIVLNDVLLSDARDPAAGHNRLELELRCVPPVLAHLRYKATEFDSVVDWLALGRLPRK